VTKVAYGISDNEADRRMNVARKKYFNAITGINGD
jgi:hypothetical protein